MMREEIQQQIKHAASLSKEDLATFLCLSGWSTENETGTEFSFENADFIAVFNLDTCGCDGCFFGSLLKYGEVRTLLGKPPLSTPALVTHIRATVDEFEAA